MLSDGGAGEGTTGALGILPPPGGRDCPLLRSVTQARASPRLTTPSWEEGGFPRRRTLPPGCRAGARLLSEPSERRGGRAGSRGRGGWAQHGALARPAAAPSGCRGRPVAEPLPGTALRPAAGAPSGRDGLSELAVVLGTPRRRARRRRCPRSGPGAPASPHPAPLSFSRPTGTAGEAPGGSGYYFQAVIKASCTTQQAKRCVRSARLGEVTRGGRWGQPCDAGKASLG